MKRASIDLHIEHLELPAGSDPAEVRRHLEQELGQLAGRGGVPTSAQLERRVAGAIQRGVKR
jgi:hypothetical protein